MVVALGRGSADESVFVERILLRRSRTTTRKTGAGIPDEGRRILSVHCVTYGRACTYISLKRGSINVQGRVFTYVTHLVIA